MISIDVEVGTHQSPEALSVDLIRSVLISRLAGDVLGQIELANGRGVVNLEVWSLKELGLTKGGIHQDVYQVGQEQGLDKRPEVGPQLLRQKLVPYGQCWFIAMDPIVDSDGNLSLFIVGHDSMGLWLGTSYGRPANFWKPSALFAFVRSAKPAF